MSDAADYAKMCFVVMPFGHKVVGRSRINVPLIKRLSWERTANFDAIYKDVFRDAIAAVDLPEGGQLVPKRADDAYYSGDIGDEMWNDIEYARIVLADISGLNPNVFIELGHRFRARAQGTVIFWQADSNLPFDITPMRVFPYEYQPAANAKKAQELITKVLKGSLKALKLDSPILNALATQRTQTTQHPELAQLLLRAENEIRRGDRAAATATYTEAVKRFSAGPLVRTKLAMLYRDAGRWEDVVRETTAAIAEMPEYSEAHREKGIAENKLFAKAGIAALPTGEAELRRAIELNPDDFDACASLGGVLRRAGRVDEAVAEYQRAAQISGGHPYPLLNALRLGAVAAKKLTITPAMELDIARARKLRLAQTPNPPADAPWCFFDLAEIALYLNDQAECLAQAREGIVASTHAWQLRTFLSALDTLTGVAGVDQALLGKLSATIKSAADTMKQ